MDDATHSNGMGGSIPHIPQRGLVVRLSLTEACQLRCTYCLPEAGTPICGSRPKPLSFAEVMRVLSRMQEIYGIRRLRFTGGEPLLRPDIVAFILAARGLGIPELGLTTNGQRLAPLAARLKQAGLNRINVSLDSLNVENYARITRGGKLEKTLQGIRSACEAGFQPIKLNCVVLRTQNFFELPALLRFAQDHNCTIRFLELMPIGEAAETFAADYVSADEMRAQLESHGFHFNPQSWDSRETSRDFAVSDACGRTTLCGFITPTSTPFCEGCNRVRLTVDGRLHGCLSQPDSLSVHALAAVAPPPSGALQTIMEAAFVTKSRPVRYRQTVSSMAMLGG